ncbi:MAG: polysaccharide-degrading enzyme, partial [Acidobacteriota bacterium]
MSLGRHGLFIAKCVLRAAAAILAGATLLAEVHEVGPGKTYEAIGQAPWAALQPGDTVLIHWRPEPYREKWVICRRGTEDAPITVRGVPGPDGQLPVVSGDQALTSPLLNFWNEARGVIKIGGANAPADLMPAYIVVENLEIGSARPGYKFTGREGVPLPYAMNAAAIYVEKAEHLTIRNCVLRDSGNGLFIGSSGAATTRGVLVEGNYIFDNGNQDSMYEHNSYTEALDIVFQFNRYGRLREGALGNNLKDRSAGLAVRYNWIEGGNRQLDLVDAGAAPILSSPRYRAAHVYGNILIEPPGEGNRQIVHYGGDSGSVDNYRKGTLYFYHNTVVSTRTDRTTLFRLSTNQERCDARNNIVYASAGGKTLSLVDSSGRLGLSHNWTKPGWVATFGTLEGAIEDDGTGIAG